MIYRSNIAAPDLAPAFAPHLIVKPRVCSLGHDVPSDSDFGPDCGFMTHDEAAILWAVANAVKGKFWLDIGSRLGWTTAHILSGGVEYVEAVDPEYAFSNSHGTSFWDRTLENLTRCGFMPETGIRVGFSAMKSDLFFDGWFPLDDSGPFRIYSGACIDGDHDAPQPLKDAQNSLARLAPAGVIVFHDFWGRPIREGVEFLLNAGLKCRVYDTPNGMAVCWRGEFTPPDHVPDPAIDWKRERRTRAAEFDFSRCE